MAQLLYFARQTEDEEQRSIAEKHAYAMLEYAERNQCRRKALLSYFGEDFEEPNCGGCDVCTGEIQEEDYTIEAQKALSAMVRSGCRFGRVLIMDILMGADNRRIRETGFQHLPTYGVGKDRTRRFWKYLIDALTRQGLAAIEGEEYPYLRVTETGWETLRGAPFRALRIVETRARRNRAERDGASQDMDVDDTLFQLLRAERRRLAEAAQVPPYVVFHDRALREMAAGKPASREAMLGIAGVGERKLAQYGDAFLAVIARYISEN
ncbi:MAG: RQC domain-containing protein [Bilophila wadsworthia]